MDDNIAKECFQMRCMHFIAYPNFSRLLDAFKFFLANLHIKKAIVSVTVCRSELLKGAFSSVKQSSA